MKGLSKRSEPHASDDGTRRRGYSERTRWFTGHATSLVRVAQPGAFAPTIEPGVNPWAQGVVQMTKLSKKSILVIVSVMALAAFAMPSMASAASWSAPGPLTGHATSLVLTGTTLLGNYALGCTAKFSGDAINTAGIAAGSITSANFGTPSTPCTGGGIALGCSVDVVATSLPWVITTSGTTLTVGGLQVVLTPTGSCPLAGFDEVGSGSAAGAWVNASSTANTFTLNNAGPLGLTLAGSAFGSLTLDGVFVVSGPHL
jgi:hypothetical protein